MSFKNFKEYLSERTTGSHGIVSDDGGFANRDYDGDLSLKPKPQQRLKPEEYYAPNAEKNPGLMTADGPDRGKPLGDLASNGLTPQKAAPFGQKPVDKTKKIGGKKKKLPTKKAMKVENFLDKTKKMNNVQFTKRLLEDVKKVPTPKILDLYGREFVPEPAQTMKYVSQLMITNENMMRRMVRELKRNNGFHLLVSEILSHPETYDCLNEAARGDYGKMVEQKISMFFEGVSPPRAATPGPASAGSPGGGGGAPQGGAFGGGSGPMQGPPAAGISGGQGAGGGFNVNAGGPSTTPSGAAGGMPGGMGGGMQGMGEDEMMPGGMGGMGGGMPGGMGGMDDSGGNMEPEDSKSNDEDDDDDLDDDDLDALGDDDDLDDDDEKEDEEEDVDDDEDDEDEFDDDDDEFGNDAGNPNMNGMGMPGMGM